MEKATHWVCLKCQEEVSVRRNQCLACHEYRSKGAELVNHGQQVEEGFSLAAEAAPPRVSTRPVLEKVVDRLRQRRSRLRWELSARTGWFSKTAQPPKNHANGHCGPQ